MEFRDYANRETAALFSKLLASQAEASLEHLTKLREALEAASRGFEASASTTPEAEKDIQDLIRKLNTAASTAARAASQRVQKEAQANLDAVTSELETQRKENERLAAALVDAQAYADLLKADLQKETERAETADRDLDAAIEAHGLVDSARLQAEAEAKRLLLAKDSLEKDLTDLHGLLDTTVAESAQASIDLEVARNENQALQDTLASERAAAQAAIQTAQEEAQASIESARGDLRLERERGERLHVALAEAEAQIGTLRADLIEAQAQADVLRIELQKETERADTADRDLDAAIEAHAHVDAARMEAEAEVRNQSNAKAAIEKDLTEVRGLLDASVAQAARFGMQLDAHLAENRTLLADLSALQAELDAARTQREAITAQLEASRARVQTLERNQTAQQAHVQQLEASLHEALEAATSVRSEATSDVDAQALADMSALRVDLDRLGSLFDASAHAVDELAAATTITDLLAALVRHVSTEFSRVALFRMKANRLEGEQQVGFDLTTDVSKLVIPLSVDSLITRAASSGVAEHITGSELADSSRVPFGGTPTVALALPIAFQGETLAVVYADSDHSASERDPAAHEASAGFAKLMVRTTAVLLMRLSQELKTLNELRDYAAMLLQEAEEMHTADMQVERNEEERRSRLKDTIECARQLYAQRASMEGPAAAQLLDDQITAAIDAEPATPFARDLAQIAGNTDRRGASRQAS
jgi:hypothetical protein